MYYLFTTMYAYLAAVLRLSFSIYMYICIFSYCGCSSKHLPRTFVYRGKIVLIISDRHVLK